MWLPWRTGILQIFLEECVMQAGARELAGQELVELSLELRAVFTDHPGAFAAGAKPLSLC